MDCGMAVTYPKSWGEGGVVWTCVEDNCVGENE